MKLVAVIDGGEEGPRSMGSRPGDGRPVKLPVKTKKMWRWGAYTNA
jgi:hypothetical protein